MSAHTVQTRLQLVGKLILEANIECLTGLHIGAGKGSLEIGGADNPVVKDAFGRPYIPGSSLRGKLRSLLEQASGLITPGELVYLSRRKGQEVRIHQSNRPDDEICLMFGRSPGRMERVEGEAFENTTASPPGHPAGGPHIPVQRHPPPRRRHLHRHHPLGRRSRRRRHPPGRPRR